MLHVMQGLPASGKTALARRIIAASGGRIRYTGLDALRLMLDGQTPVPQWAPGAEAATEKAQAALVASLLADGHDVLVDGTHLHPCQMGGLRAALRGSAFTVRIHTLTAGPARCCARDARRTHPIGAQCIARLARQHRDASAAGWRLTPDWLTGKDSAPCHSCQ